MSNKRSFLKDEYLVVNNQPFLVTEDVHQGVIKFTRTKWREERNQ